MADNADKRSVHTDALETLGTILDESQKRDAIHLAVEPTVATERLYPGQHIDATGGTKGKLVGIVDPYLTKPVFPGERFWLVVYPRQIKSLRHVWTHPDFKDIADPAPETTTRSAENLWKYAHSVVGAPTYIKSQQWIKDYAEDLGLEYDDLLQGAAKRLRDDYYFLNRGELLEGIGTKEEFWVHYAIVTGEEVPKDKRGNFFTCSC